MRNRPQNLVAGYSLIELVIVIGIIGMLSLGMATVLQNIVFAQGTNRFQGAAEATNNEIRSVLKKPLACFNTFNPIVLNGVVSNPIAAIKNELDITSYLSGGTFGDGALRIIEMRAMDYVATSATGNGEMYLRISYASSHKVFGSQTIVRTIKIETTKNLVTHAMTGCSASGFVTGQLDCQARQGVVNNASAIVTCAADEYVISGGGECKNPCEGGPGGPGGPGICNFNGTGGFVHLSRPLPDLSGWEFDCFDEDGDEDGIDDTPGSAWAVCCKK